MEAELRALREEIAALRKEVADLKASRHAHHPPQPVVPSQPWTMLYWPDDQRRSAAGEATVGLSWNGMG